MKNILYTIILSFLFSSSVFADYKAGYDAYHAGDYATALKEWKPLAEQGDAYAQHSLGAMYKNGDGVTQDYKEAERLYKLAAERGHANAQNSLGFMYAMGVGVIKDVVIAHMWYNIAALSGDKEAVEQRDNVAKKMTPSQIETAQKLARKCIRKKYKGC